MADPVFVAASAGENATGGSTLTIAVPAGVSDGDVLIAMIHQHATGGVASLSGWTQEISLDHTDGFEHVTVLTKVAASESGSYVFNLTASSNRAAGVVQAWSDVDTSDPVEASGSQSNGSGTSVTAPSITPLTAGAAVVWFGGLGGASTATAPAPSGYTQPTNGKAASSGGGSAGLKVTVGTGYKESQPASATGSQSATWGTSGTRNIGVQLALKPLATGGPASGSGSPVATLSKTASGTAVQQFNASGSPVATLSKTASGTATLTFNASGSPVATLSRTASGTAVLTFNAAGSPAATLSSTASGTATMTPDPVTGSGSPVATLSATASGTAVLKFNASGSPVATLSAFTTSSTAVQSFNASGAPVATLGASASGTATMTPDVGGPTPVSGSGSPVATLSATASGTAVEQFNASGSPVATLSPTASGTAAQKFNAAGTDVATLSATASGTATMTPDVVEPPSVTGSGSPVATLSAFVVSSPTRRRAKGGIKFVYTDDEEEKEEPTPAAVVEAEPLPDVQEVFPMLGHVEIDPETWKRAAQGLELTRSVKPVAKAGQPIDEDEEIEDLLHVLAAIF